MNQRRKLNEIEMLALRIVSTTPMRPSGSLIQGHWTGTAYVAWQYIMELRKAFEDAGVDWKAIHRLVKQEKLEARKKRAERYR